MTEKVYLTVTVQDGKDTLHAVVVPFDPAKRDQLALEIARAIVTLYGERPKAPLESRP